MVYLVTKQLKHPLEGSSPWMVDQGEERGAHEHAYRA